MLSHASYLTATQGSCKWKSFTRISRLYALIQLPIAVPRPSLKDIGVLQARRRRMQGAVRLQEVPLSMQPSYTEDKFFEGVNAKVQQDQQQAVNL